MDKNQYAVKLGQLGGKKGGVARANNLSPERRKEIAQKAAQARWAKNNQPYFESEIMPVWKKKLTRSDAQQDTQGAKMPFLRFIKANLSVDHTTYFRTTFFAQADWLKSSDQAERVGITISVKLPMHTAPIDRQMILDFDPARSENHSAPTVHLMYDEQTKRELERQDLSDQEVEVSSNNGTYHLIVQ